MNEPDPELLDAVCSAANRPDVLAALATVYRDLADRTARRSPRCDRSGQCCRFENYGHRLYVSTIELAGFARGLSVARRFASASWDGRGCPYQEEGLCSVHDIRPFGCRLFFCDPTSSAWQEETYAELHGRIRGLHDRLMVPYHYLEWRQALRRLGLDQPGLPSTGGKSFPLRVLSRHRTSL